MWALRRSSANYLKASGLNIAAFRACAGLGPVSSNKKDKSSASELHLFTADRRITTNACKCTICNAKQFSVGYRYLSSQAGANSGGEEDDDLEDGFSELETPEVTETAEADIVDDNNTSDSTSDSDSDSDLLSLDAGDESLETVILGDPEDAGKPKKEYASSPLFKLLMKEHGSSIPTTLDKYFEGKDLCRTEVYQALLSLRRRKIFGKALQLSEWLEGREDFDFSERDYASKLDLLAKVRGVDKAEIYLDTIPKSFREEVVYRTLLANCVSQTLVHKAEQVFNKMKDLGFPITVFTCNQMLLLYKRTDKRKIGDMLVLMEKENIKPSVFTYQVLVDTKGQSGDIKGMEQVVETMKASDVEPNIRIQAALARHYATAGLKEKAEAALKEIEKNARHISAIILPIYASLGNSEDVERIWKIIESKPRLLDFLAAIGAFGKLKNIEMAESIFEKMTKLFKNLSSKHYTPLLKVYAENKMLSKGKELIKRMADAGVNVGPVACDALVKLYVDIGEVEKADSVLQKVVKQNPRLRPMFSSYMILLYQYSRRGDVHNAEKIFQKMRVAGYVSRAKPFHALLQTYINAKVPAYGIRERMKADNIYPNKGLATQLALVDLSKRNSISDLLD